MIKLTASNVLSQNNSISQFVLKVVNKPPLKQAPWKTGDPNNLDKQSI